MGKETKGGCPARVGEKFHEEIERIKRQRIVKGTSKEKVATEKLTNLIVRHKEAWKIISDDLINTSEEELEEKWK